MSGGAHPAGDVWPDPASAHARDRPHAPAVVTAGAVWSWADLNARVGACAARLQAEGVGSGDEGRGAIDVPRVGVVARTSPDLVVLLLGALRAGAVVVPLSPRWPAAALAGAVGRLGLDLLAVGPDAPAISGTPTVALADLAAPGPALRAPTPRDAPFSQPWTVVHTSGSTGAPKAALHTVGNHVWSARGVTGRLGLRAGDRWLLDLPLAHVGGLGVVARCALVGAAMAFPEPGVPVAEAVRTLAPTHASLVSTQLVRLLRDGPERAGLRAVLLGGSAVAAGLLDEAAARGLPLATGYGMTETTSTVTATAPGASRADLATSGTPMPGREVRVGPDGEVHVRGPVVFAGYLTPAGLRRPVGADGWLATGDLGAVDAEGRLTVGGRRDSRFVSGGEAVQPEAVEAALARLPGVAEAVVVPVPDAEWGARPVAFVRPSGPTLPAADALARALREGLPVWAVPVAFHEWAGPAGLKPDRRALAAEAERRRAGRAAG